MTTRYHKFVDGECYHIYNRGNGKMEIFHDKEDREKFIKLLRFANEDKRVSLKDKINVKTPRGTLGVKLVFIGAYTLMPNHFHILLKQNIPDGIPKFLLKVSTGYAMYYNKKYKRTGSLFEGPFKSKIILGDYYLKYMFSYIHLNCLKLIDKNWKENKTLDSDKYLDFLGKYLYSSYLDYMRPNSREEQIILDRSVFPNYFNDKHSIQKEIYSWVKKD